MPVEDVFAKKRQGLPNGRMVYDMYLIQVKKPDESKSEWDYYKQLAKVPATRPSFAADSGCQSRNNPAKGSGVSALRHQSTRPLAAARPPRRSREIAGPRCALRQPILSARGLTQGVPRASSPSRTSTSTSTRARSTR